MDSFTREVLLCLEVVNEARGDIPLGRALADGCPELENDADLMYIIGWINGAAKARGLLPEQLIDRCLKTQRAAS